MTRAPRTPSRVDLGDAPTITQPEPATDASRLCLVVVGESTFATHPLPRSGVVRIGRSDKSDVRIDDPSVSREHAKIHIGDGLWVEDLGSANGTTVDKKRIAPNSRVEFQADHIIEAGSTMLIVQRTTFARPRRIWSHDYFEARLEEECERAGRLRSSFAVVRIHAPDPADALGWVHGVISSQLGSGDVLAAYGPGEYELLLARASEERAADVVESLTVALEEREVSVRAGIAVFPGAGRTPEALIASACETVLGEPAQAAGPVPVILRDTAMLELQRIIARVGAGRLSVLLTGETGVGKEIVAEMVHNASPRANKAFLRLNCAAISETLLESELFGHEKGAFTGAERTKPGLLESAEGGTVFLDEVGELSSALQVKLLRVLEERKVMRVGALEPRSIDVRFVAATNRDLEAEVLARNFRADLFFRLGGITLVIPPLRERPSEIQPLAEAFAEHFARACGRAPLVISPEAFALLERYGWPGNIRELRNVMERAVLLAEDVIRPEHLPVEKMRATLLAPASWDRPAGVEPLARPTGVAHRGTVDTDTRELPRANAALVSDLLMGDDEAERQRIVQALEQCGGNQTQAARRLGMSRRTLVSRLDKYDLPRPRKA